MCHIRGNNYYYYLTLIIPDLFFSLSSSVDNASLYHDGGPFFSHRISVENAYLEEKEDTCCALGELAMNTG